jgi:hypothetical protein
VPSYESALVYSIAGRFLVEGIFVLNIDNEGWRTWPFENLRIQSVRENFRIILPEQNLACSEPPAMLRLALSRPSRVALPSLARLQRYNSNGPV